jgi:phage I-like protein
LGLDGADDAAFLKTCDHLVKLTRAFVTQLELPADTAPAGLLDALSQRGDGRSATASQAPDLAATVAVIQTLASQAETYRQRITQSEVDKLVDVAMRDGKITPAMRPWLTTLAHQDFSTFKGLVESLPPAFAHLFTSDFKGRTAIPPEGEDAGGGLSSGQLAVCSQLGLSPDDYRQTLKG